MFKNLLLIFIFCFTALNGSIIEDKIENLIGQKKYKIHQNLIGMLFKKESKYLINDQINYYNLFKELKSNGLLNLSFNKPKDVIIEFKSLCKSLKSYKILLDTMRYLGYRHFFTKSLSRENDVLTWKITFRTEYMLDPVVLLKELQLKNCKILNVENRSSNYWYYELDFKDSILNRSVKIENNERVKFHKPLKPYMLNIQEASSLEVKSHSLNRWFPSISFFDKDLLILKVFKRDRVYKGYKIKIPKNTKYIKIDDLYNLINIKRGLTITVR